MKFYRIKQISENQFTPQVCDSIIHYIFNEWNQIFLTTDTLEKARKFIEQYKQLESTKNKYPKYHKA